ncbi:hypothetical protein KR093_001654, partial [Drosophila rubida]
MEANVNILVLIALTVAIVSIECVQNSNVIMQVSRNMLREGDRYNVTCWVANRTELQCPEGKEIYLETQDFKRVETRHLNSTAIYHEVTSAQAQGPHDGYYCICDGVGLMALNFPIGVWLNITNFACRFLDVYGSELKCNFNVPLRAFEMNLNTTYQMKYYNRIYNCVLIKPDNTLVECIVPSGIFDKFRAEFELTIIMTDVIGDLNTTFRRSRIECVVLPAIGEGLQLLNRSSNAICLEWSEKQKSNHRPFGIAYDVQVQPPNRFGDFKWQRLMSNKLLRDSYCLSQLLPHQHYNLSVRRRLDDPLAVWSEPFVYEFSTADAIPARAPFVWSNAYTVDSDRKLLFVYWQQLQTSEYLGDNFTYSVSVLLRGQEKSPVARSNIQVESNMANISSLLAWAPRSGTYIVTVRSQNNVGLSENSSRIVISQLADAKDRQPTSLCFDKKAHQLRWKAPSTTTDLLTYTVYWCVSNTTDAGRCQDSMRLEAINTNSLQNLFALSQDDSYRSNRWGVAGNFSSSAAGGIVWWDGIAQCNDVSSGSSVEGITALGVLGILLYCLIRKCRYMSDIKVDLPPGV